MGNRFIKGVFFYSFKERKKKVRMKIIYLKTGRFTQHGLFLYQIQIEIQVVKHE